jgi:hypothetical protein
LPLKNLLRPSLFLLRRFWFSSVCLGYPTPGYLPDFCDPFLSDTRKNRFRDPESDDKIKVLPAILEEGLMQEGFIPSSQGRKFEAPGRRTG